MKAFEVEDRAKVFVYSKPINMIYSFPRLMNIVEEELHKKLVRGDLYVFANKKRDYVKILFFSNGPCILAKKLIAGKFNLEYGSRKLTISGIQDILDRPEL